MSTRFLENETVHLLQEIGSENAPPQERTPPVLLGCNPPSTVRLSLNALSTRPRPGAERLRYVRTCICNRGCGICAGFSRKTALLRTSESPIFHVTSRAGVTVSFFTDGIAPNQVILLGWVLW